MKTKYIPIVLLVGIVAAPSSVSSQESTGNPFAQAKFVPDISLILDSSFVFRNLDDEQFNYLSLPGFSHTGPEDRAAELSDTNINQGFNLNYVEMTLSSVVDPYFDLFAVFHLSSRGFTIEEAYFTTRRLPKGLQVKGGKFLSHFGRINGQHAHYWDFASLPLVLSAFFGSSGLDDLGIRLTWVAPLDIFLQFGIELLQGKNEMSFGNEGFELPAFSVDDVQAPGIVVATAKTSFDLGNLTVLAGLSNAYGQARLSPDLGDENSTQAFAGTTNVFGADLTLKYLFDSIRYLSLQTELMTRTTSGDRYELDAADSWCLWDQTDRQAGLYTQAVARLNKRLRLGARLDLIWENNINCMAIPQELPENLMCYTVMGEWNPTEFSRLRVQYVYDRSRCEKINGDWERQPFHELTLQVNITIGAHGAHAF